ncbi:MAG TPA: hydroxyisourate hydrolase [Elusimicrobiota bacterium]|jgi:5-hydroxyisourate hydrolase|nr:hydroxyisourate hydrolase [Elusimicrobiota bacterium]
MKSPITTHVLDTSLGRPAAGVPVTLELRLDDGTWQPLSEARTDADGRAMGLLPAAHKLVEGVYRLTFDTAAYFRAKDLAGFYPYVSVPFEIHRTGEHYHVPLLLSPHGYSTYRGS